MPQSAAARVAVAGLAAELVNVEVMPAWDAPQALDRLGVIETELSELSDRTDHQLESLRMRILLVRADVTGRRGQTAASARTFRSVQRWAESTGDVHVKARTHRLLAMFFSTLGDDAAFLEQALRSVELLEPGDPDLTLLDHLSVLALAQGRTGAGAGSYQTFERAERLAVQLAQPELQIRLVNNLSYVADLLGDHDQAAEQAERLQRLIRERGCKLLGPHVDTIARAYLTVGRLADAQQVLGTFLDTVDVRDPGSFTAADGPAMLLLTLAEVQRAQGALAEADESLTTCQQISLAQGLKGIRIRLRHEVANLREAQGRYQEAYLELKVYLAESEALNTAARDVRLRTLQTIHETEQHRRASAMYQELALRDPLTGLYNRRYVDTTLPPLLAGLAGSRVPVSAAFIDLDHFKRINDAVSHDAGDQVLRRFAALLAETAGQDCWAARMGGEEFLLFLPGMAAAEALAICESLQSRIRAADWAAAVGDLPVRASIGVAHAATGGVSQATLLAAADRYVYLAKAEGRDRVVSGPAARSAEDTAGP